MARRRPGQDPANALGVSLRFERPHITAAPCRAALDAHPDDTGAIAGPRHGTLRAG